MASFFKKKLHVYFISLDCDIHLRKFKKLRSQVHTAMSSLQRTVHEYLLPLIIITYRYTVNNYLPLIKLRLFTVNNNYLLLIKLFTVNNNNLPLMKTFTVNRIICR